MQILFQPYKIDTTYQPIKIKAANPNPQYNISQLAFDTYQLSFCGLKKSAFEGIDYYVVNKYKAPIEKFKNLDAFFAWAEKKCNEILNFNYGGRRAEAKNQRIALLREWKEYLENENMEYSSSEKLMIADGITKNLKPDNDTIPPILNKGVLADTVYNLKKDLRADKNSLFSFDKTYENNLRSHYLEDISTGETGTKWVVIKSKTNDTENFEENVKRLQMLSHKSWCTKSYNAEPYLSKGDFHVYLENGQPKIGIRFKEDNIEEIQGEKNNSKIPTDYLKIVKEHISENKLALNENAEHEIKEAETRLEKITEIKEALKPVMEKNDTKALLQELGFGPEYDESGNIILETYGKPKQFGDISLKELGIDEARLLENVVKIKGNADFEESQISKFNKLREIGGNLYLKNNKYIKSLQSIKKIGGVLYIDHSELTDLGELTELGRICGIDVQLKSLGNIKRINGSIFISGSNFETLGELETVDGNVDLAFTKSLKSLGKLKHVKGDLSLRSSSVEDLGELETVSGNLYLNETEKIKSLGKLKSVGGNVNLYDSAVKDLGMLESAAAIDITNTEINSLKNMQLLKSIKMKNKKQLKDLGRLQAEDLGRFGDRYLVLS